MTGLRIGLLNAVGLCFIALAGFAQAEDPPSAVGPVMKLLQSGRVPPERMATIVEMICNRGNEHDLKVIFDRVVKPDGFSPEVRRQVLKWLAEAASTRKVKPAGQLNSLEDLVTTGDPRLQLEAIRLASSWQLSTISPSLVSLATDVQSTPELQRAALDGLVSIADEISQKAIRELASSNRPMRIRMHAIAGLVALDLPAAAQQAAAALSLAIGQDDPSAMLNAFLNRKGGSLMLAAAVDKQRPQIDVAKMALRYMYSIGRSDPELSAVLSAAAGVASDPPPPTQEEIAQLVAEVIRQGDPARGEKIFRRGELSCLRCHALSRAGGQVGPDLSAIGVSSPVDYLVNSILNPNLAVKEQYVTKLFILASGQILTGVVVDRDENRVLMRDAQGKVVTLPTADIEEEADGKSLMPQGLTKFLTHDEVIDLCRFISELGKPGPYAIASTPSIRLWRVMNNPPDELTHEVPHLEHIRELVLGSPIEQWSSAYSNVAGALPLDELKANMARRILILQGQVDVKEAGELTFDILSTEPFQVWMDAESFASNEQVVVSLQPGKHTITLRVEISEGEGHELRVNVSKPTDSTAQFEVVGGA